MVDFASLTTTDWVLLAVTGIVGGLAYDYYYKLLTIATYLSALQHIGAGIVAVVIVVLTGAFGPPTDSTSFLLLAAFAYGGTDVIDSFIQKLQTPPTSASSSSTPGPPA
jgi:hypothetical protein